MSRPDDGALPGDPFWDVVQQRHPDVDIVILPPEPAMDPDDAPPATSAADARRLAREVDELFDEIWDLVLTAHHRPETAVRWVSGSASGSGAAVRSARVDHLESDEARRLVTVADAALTARTWRVSPPEGPLHRLTATADGVTVTVSAHQDTCRLEVRGPEVALGRDVLRGLRQEVGA